MTRIRRAITIGGVAGRGTCCRLHETAMRVIVLEQLADAVNLH